MIEALLPNIVIYAWLLVIAVTGSWTLPSDRSTGWAVPPRLWPRWDLRIGDKHHVLPRLVDQLPRIDLFVYDVPHNDRRDEPEFRAIDSRMPARGVAIADHGPGGELCRMLGRWAGRYGAKPVRRAGLGLFGFRKL